MKRGPLHNDVSIALEDATNAQIEASINWYEKSIPEWVTLAGRSAPQLFFDNLAILKAERANRLGR